MRQPTQTAARRILVWPADGPWTTSFVRGRHEYLPPVEDLRHTDVDLVVLQRPDELELAAELLGRRPGQDVPAVYVEHDTPPVPNARHPIAGRPDITLVHVTAFNDLMWDSGFAPTVVIDHGIPDPGYRYTGEFDSAAVVINEPVRRWRATGTDLLPRFADAMNVDVYGTDCDGLTERMAGTTHPVRVWGDMPTDRLYTALGRRRCYLHPTRWTSLGSSLIEAMHLGLPVVGLATTETVEAVPPEAGVLSTDVEALVDVLHLLREEPGWAAQLGKQARETALAAYGLERFLVEWDHVIEQVIGD